MQAIILAAGCGSRLAPASNGKPKCLVKVGDVPLIEYHLAVLESFGITDVCLVLGYRADDITQVVGDRCHYIINRQYAETNSLYSLWLARKWVRGPFLLVNGDVLAHPQIYQRLLANSGNVLAYDSWSGTEEEQMKVAFKKGKLRKISKTLTGDKAQGESIGLLKFKAKAAKSLFLEAEAALFAGGKNQWVPAAVARLARKRSITGVDIAGLPWVEIDFPQDWQNACEKVWPSISKTLTSPLLKRMVASPTAFSQLNLSYGMAS
ncbi:MAG: NTP transferase domain-containing protein [Xenococcaceae cyanobacterium]